MPSSGQGDAHRQQRPLAALARGQLGGAPRRRRRREPRRRCAAARCSAPPLAGRAATTRPITIAGSRSSRSATRRTRSSRLAVSPIAAEDRRHLGQRAVALDRRGDVGAVEHQPDLEVGRARRRRRSGRGSAPAPPAAAIISAGSSPAGIAATRSRILRPAATRWARSIASWPAESASSASTTSSTIPESVATCSPVIAVPITADRLLDPGLVQGEDVGVALDHDRPRRPWRSPPCARSTP